MYVHPAFKTADEDAWAFVAKRGFGTLIAVDGRRPTAVHVPFLVDRSKVGPRIELHVARANPIHSVIGMAPGVLLTVTGPDAYISPDWYVSAEQVPTWNYVAVHLSGTARALDGAAAEDHVTRLSGAFEERLKPKAPWKMEKVSRARMEAMLRAIVVIEIAVTGLEATRKLAQHKTKEDQAAVARMLSWQGDWNAAAIAEMMHAEQLRRSA
jgi:transcriptional regulator